MNKIAIVSAKRTPIGRFRGKLSDYSAIELGTTALKAALDEVNINPNEIEQVIFGNVLQSGSGQNPARQIGIKSGIPNTTPAMTINEVCGSGLKSIILGKQLIQLGETKVVAVGGVEGLGNADVVGVAVTLVGDHQSVGAYTLHAGGHRAGAAMAAVEPVALQSGAQVGGAPHADGEDDVVQLVQLLKRFHDQTADDAMPTAGTKVHGFVHQGRDLSFTGSGHINRPPLLRRS